MTQTKHTPRMDLLNTVDPRGPHREITAIDCQPHGTFITKSCGHTGTHNQIFQYKVGEDIRCFQCGRDQIAAINKATGAP